MADEVVDSTLTHKEDPKPSDAASPTATTAPATAAAAAETPSPSSRRGSETSSTPVVTAAASGDAAVPGNPTTSGESPPIQSRNLSTANSGKPRPFSTIVSQPLLAATASGDSGGESSPKGGKAGSKKRTASVSVMTTSPTKSGTKVKDTLTFDQRLGMAARHHITTLQLSPEAAKVIQPLTVPSLLTKVWILIIILSFFLFFNGFQVFNLKF